MVEAKQISKFFLALVSNGGEMSRADLAVKVFSRNWNAKQLNELLKAPSLCGLTVESKERVRGTGRSPRRYVLTPLGWEIARAWQLPVRADTIAPEEVQRQFQRLILDGNPWAVTMDKDARAWRAHQEAQRREREAKAAAAQEKKRERELTHPLVKHPSKDRTRSQKDMAERSRWFEAKKAERAITPPPVSPSFREDSDAPRYSQFAPVTPLVVPRPVPANDDPPYLNGETLALIRKITSAGYRTNANGEVLYDNRWITVSEWMKLMPGAIA